MKRFLVLALMWASAAFGQVFTTLYLPTAGSGLTLNIAAGRAFCGGSVVTYAGGTLTMAASVTNRVYLNTASSCAPAVKSTAFTSSDIPVATVVTSGSAITGLTDVRTMFDQILVSTQTSGGQCSLGIGGLVGAFTDGSGVIKQTLCIGAGPINFIVPTGATQLQLGVIDDNYSGTPNTGSFVVAVGKNGGSSSNYTVLGTAGPWSTVTNSSYPYSINDFTSPVVVTGFVAGDLANVKYVSGTIVVGGTVPCTSIDANGCLLNPPGRAGFSGPTGSALSPTSTYWPTKYMSAQAQAIASLALTTTGASGPATLVNGVLNIPQYSGGTTTNPLTAQTSGGASPGDTFDGSLAKTWDYHTFGALPLNNATPTGNFDGSALSSEKLPVSAGCVTTANGNICYDSTNKNWHLWVNGADSLVIPLAAGFVSGHCGQPTDTGGTWTIVDIGFACGASGGGASFSAVTSGVNTTAAMQVGSGASLAPTGAGTIQANNVNGTIAAGSGIAITGGGTTGSPYSIAVTGGAGGQAFETRPLKTVVQEYLSCAAGAICQMMSVSGPGTLSAIHMSASASTCTNNSILDVVADGVLVVSAPASLVFGATGQTVCGGGTAQTFSSPKLSLNSSASDSFGGIVHWTIPYASSLKIYFEQDSGSSATMFFNGDYYDGAPPAGLYPSQWAYFNGFYAYQSVAQYANFIPLPTFSGVGALESINYYVAGSSLTSLEGDASILADGNTYAYNGTEDLFCGSNYFATLKGNISGSCGSAYIGTTSAGMFRFFSLLPTGTDNRPVPFTSSLALSFPNGASGQGTGPGTVTAQSLTTWYSTTAPTIPTYTGNSCQNFTNSVSTTSSTCVLKVLQAGDTIAGFVGVTSLTTVTASCGTASIIRTQLWAGGAVSIVAYDVPNATAGSCTLTFTYPNQTNVNSMALDIANANTSSPIDNTNCTSSPFCSTTGTGNVSTITGAAITTSGTNELVLGFAIYGTNGTLAGTAGWNYVPQTISNDSQTTEFYPAFPTGTYTPLFASSGGSGGSNWVTTTIAIKH